MVVDVPALQVVAGGGNDVVFVIDLEGAVTGVGVGEVAVRAGEDEEAIALNGHIKWVTGVTGERTLRKLLGYDRVLDTHAGGDAAVGVDAIGVNVGELST